MTPFTLVVVGWLACSGLCFDQTCVTVVTNEQKEYATLEKCIEAGSQYAAAPGGPHVVWGCRPSR